MHDTTALDRQLLDTTTELVCATGPDGRITYVNRAWRRTLGYTLEDAARLRAVDMVAPEHRGPYLDVARRLFTGAAVEAFEAVLLATDGRRVACRGRAVPVLVDDPAAPGGQRYAGACAAYRDVTAERHAEAARARLVATLETTGDVVGTARADGQLETLNRAGRRLLGLSDDTDLSALRAADYYAPETLDALARVGLPRAVRDGTWAGEGALLGARGDAIPVSIALVAHPALTPGEPPFFSAVMRDLRDRVAAEARLRESHRALAASHAALAASESRFRAAVEGSLDAFLLLDGVRDASGALADFTFLDCNARAERLVGLPRADLLGERLCELFPLHRAHGLFARYAQAVEAGETTEFEFEPADPRVAARWLRVQAVPVGTGVALSLRDVTERKQAEVTLRALALVDELTGLYNRRGFLALAESALARARAEARGAVLAFLDLDGLKVINDAHGHAEGDRALQAAADVVRGAVRGSDTAARLGGDEFVALIVPGGPRLAPAHAARRLALTELLVRRRLAEQLAAHNAGAAGAGRPYAIGLSIGTALAPPDGPDLLLTTLMIEADERLYAAKRARGALGGAAEGAARPP